MNFYFKNIKLFKRCLAGMLFSMTTLSFAYNTISDDSRAGSLNTYPEDWLPGCVVFKRSTDTLVGYLKMKSTPFGCIEKVWFRKNKEVKKGTIKIGGIFFARQDTLQYFEVANTRYKYINITDETMPAKRFFQSQSSLTGWVEIIEKGSIILCKGYSVSESYNGGMMAPTSGGGMMMTGGGSSKRYTPMYYLKKRSGPMALIASPTIGILDSDIMLYKIDERNKDHFVDFISNYPELAERVKNKELLFGEIEKIVSEYNNWAKSDN